MSGSGDRLKIITAKSSKLRQEEVVGDYDGPFTRAELEEDMAYLAMAVHGLPLQSASTMMDMVDMS